MSKKIQSLNNNDPIYNGRQLASISIVSIVDGYIGKRDVVIGVTDAMHYFYYVRYSVDNSVRIIGNIYTTFAQLVTHLGDNRLADRLYQKMDWQ